MKLTTNKELTELAIARMERALENERVVVCMKDPLCLAAFSLLPAIRSHLACACTRAYEAEQAINETFSTYLIIDDVPESGSGLELCKKFRHLKTVLLTERENDGMVKDAGNAGVDALIFRSQVGGDGSGALIAGLAQVARGGVYLPQSVLEHAGEADEKTFELIATLTEKERVVLAELGRGLDNASIAEVLFLSEETVKSHLKAVRQKMNETDRVKLALLSFRVGL